MAGGIVGPVLLMLGLTGMPASGAPLLLNAEGVFTALLAWFAFKENFDRRIALGMATIMAGAMVLSWSGEARFAGLWPALAVLGACFAWGIDNNLTHKVSLSDAIWIASVKGLVAGSVNLVLAFSLGATLPPIPNIAGAIVVGFFAYGVKSGPVCCGPAPSRHGTYWGLFLSRPVFRGSVGDCAGGIGDTAITDRWRVDGGWHLAASNRASQA